MNLFTKKPTDPSALYRPTDGDLTNKQIAISVWLLKHKEMFISIGTFSLILWSIVTIGYSSYRWAEYAIVGYRQDTRLLAESASLIQPYDNLQSIYSARPLNITSPTIIVSGDSIYDITTFATNPNQRHIAFVTFLYTFSNTTTEEKTIAILPGQKQALAELGIQHNGYPNTPTLRILSTKWQRISPHAIFEVEPYTKERLNIELKDITYNAASSVSTPTDQLQFTLLNNSAYSFYQVNGYIVIYNADGVSGIRPITIDRFTSLEERSFDFRFIYPLNGVQEIEFLPLVNIFDQSTFIKP